MFEQRILELFADINPYEEITAETDLFEESVLDSLSLLTLVDFLENEFRIEIPIEEITKQDFRNIVSINEFVCKKINNGGDE